jgi:N-acetylglucosamine-6-sulfatase
MAGRCNPKGRARSASGVLLLSVAALTLAMSAPDVAGSNAPAAAPFERAAARPNIVLILADDQRVDQLSRMPIVQARLVEQGVSFPNAFVVDPLCCPARATILRGQYSHTTRIYGIVQPYGGAVVFNQLGLQRSTIATWLDAAGYRTALIGKYLNAYKQTSSKPPGWDVWNAFVGTTEDNQYYHYKLNTNGVTTTFGGAPADYSTDVLATRATDFIQNTAAKTPLFLYFAPTAPHLPATPAPRHATDPRCTGAVNSGYVDGHVGPPPSINEPDASDKPAWVRNKLNVDLSTMASSWVKICRTLLAVDDAVGRIVGALEQTGRLDNTLIVYTSDNGLLRGEHRLQYKKAFYEESIRVPMVIRYPGVAPADTEDDRFVLDVDLASTFADAAGVNPGVPQEGTSLLPLLDGSAGSWRTSFLVEHADPPGTFADSRYVPTYCAIRTATHAFAVLTTGEEELYDLVADPYELENLLRPSGGHVDPADLALRNTLWARLFTGLNGKPPMCFPLPPGYPGI